MLKETLAAQRKSAYGVRPVFLKDLSFRNLKGFAAASFKFRPQPGKFGEGGWYVLLGENGTGKTTVLQSIAVVLAGRREAPLLIRSPEEWIRSSKDGEATCELSLRFGRETPKLAGETLDLSLALSPRSTELGITIAPSPSYSSEAADQRERTLYNHSGFVLAGYGPYRRLRESSRHGTFLDPAAEDRLPFGSLFFPAALTDSESWLQRLDYEYLEAEPSERPQLRERRDAVISVINQLLPSHMPIRLHSVGGKGVRFLSANERPLSVSQVSDGYRTMFALAVDLLRWIVERAKPGRQLFRQEKTGWVVSVPGIVLIDEVEAHLHPKWQREISFFLQRTFPNIQFIVATHSPFIAQAATPGGIFVLTRDQDTDSIHVNQSVESLRGWRAEQILSSPAFDLPMTRDIVTEDLLKEHAQLQAKKEVGVSLSEAEEQRLAHLRTVLRDTLPPPSESFHEIKGTDHD